MSRLPTTPGRRQANTRQLTPGSAAGRSSIVAATPRPRPASVVVQQAGELAQFSHAATIAVTPSGDETQFVVGSQGGAGGLIDEGTIFCSDNGTAGSTVLTIYVNGSSIGTLTFGNGDTTPQTDPLTPTRVVPGDRVGARVTSVATGAKGLSGFVSIKP